MKTTLGKLSKWAVRKHNIEIITITGWAGTAITRELIYHILSDKFTLRRNTRKIWWDLSLPLTVLGYEDKRKNFFQWLFIIFKSIFSVIFISKHPHKIIVDIDTSVEETADFWSDLLRPDIIIITKKNPKSKLLDKFISQPGWEKSVFVFNPDELDIDLKSGRKFTYSNQNSDLVYKTKKTKLDFLYEKNEFSINIPKHSPFLKDFIPPAISASLLQGMRVKDILSKISTFDLHPYQYKSAFNNLKRFIEKND